MWITQCAQKIVLSKFIEILIEIENLSKNQKITETILERTQAKNQQLSK